MPPKASLRFVSLFVPDLEEARRTYEALLGTPPAAGPSPAPAPHPFAAEGPVVFVLGGVALALYQADGKTTHAGDVGIGIETAVNEAASAIREHGGLVFWGPEALGEDRRRMAVGVLKDRHFFEVVEGVSSPAAVEGSRRSNG
jgi:catechol 2,3-dioxygenase-like lactoylglutathione lyase family enzyme